MLDLVMETIRDQDITLLTGKAGTGKTTLTREIIQSWRGTIHRMAPTGRAARRSNEVCGSGCRTIHSSIYGKPFRDSNGKHRWSVRKKIGGYGHLVVVDEISMVGMRVYRHLLQALQPDTKLLLVGDGNQLPPVQGQPAVDFSKADVRLEKVWRNDGGVLAFAHAILACENTSQLRELVLNPHFKGVAIKNVRDLPPTKWKTDLMQCGQDAMLISFTNATRFRVNHAVRKRLGYQEPLVRGETLLVRTNDLDYGVVNGELVELLDLLPPVVDQPVHLTGVRFRQDNPEHTENDAFVALGDFEADAMAFREHREADSKEWYKLAINNQITNEHWKMEARAVREDPTMKYELLGPYSETLHMQYGYGLTCHSAQGGEADNVGILWDADWMFKPKYFETAKAWWYTAATRAKHVVNIWHM
jgi:hypothetical protein